jgi:hypothetical protein
MIRKSTLAVLAAAVAVSFTSQAFGQAATSYGDVRPYHYGSDGSRKSGSWTAEQQGSTNAGQAQASGRQGQAGTQRAERTRGYSAFGQAPARRSTSEPARR